MRKKGKSSWLRASVATLLLFATFCLISCSITPRPELYTGYDILRPNEEVRKNPLGFTEDGNLIVNKEFMLWVYELKEEIKKLREDLKKKEK